MGGGVSWVLLKIGDSGRAYTAGKKGRGLALARGGRGGGSEAEEGGDGEGGETHCCCGGGGGFWWRSREDESW